MYLCVIVRANRIDQETGNYDDAHEQHNITEFVLTSHPVPPKTNYAVGVLRGGTVKGTSL